MSKRSKFKCKTNAQKYAIRAYYAKRAKLKSHRGRVKSSASAI